MKYLKLIVEDIKEETFIDELEEYKFYKMEDLYEIDRFKDKANANKFDKDFNDKDKWFMVVEDLLVSLSNEELDNLLKEKEEEILELYSDLENAGETSKGTEIKTELLDINLAEGYDLEDFEDREVIYQDVNLESIAEILDEVTVKDLKAQLSYYGSWTIAEIDGMNYLVS